MPEEFDLKKILRRTPEEIRDDEDAQAESAKRLGGKLAASPAAANYRFAVGMEKDARDYFAVNKRKKAKNYQIYLRRLAESLFLQGKFKDAAAAAPDGAQKIEYGQYAAAADRSGTGICDCPPVQFQSGKSAKGVKIPARREVQTVYSQPLEREISFIFCDSCRKLFA